MLDATDVRGHDAFGSQRVQVPELAIAQLVRDLGKQHGVRAGGAAAQVTLGRHFDIEAECGELCIDAAQLLPMLQGARGVKGHARTRARQTVAEREPDVRKELGEIPGERRDALCFVRIVGVVPQLIAVFLGHLAAGGGVGDDRLDAAVEVGPPRIDIAAHVGEAPGAVVEMRAHRSATPRARRERRLDAGSVQHAHRGGD